MKMTLYMETTKKNPEETLAEIQLLLKQLNIKDILINYDNGEISGFSFSINKFDYCLYYKMPIDHKPIWIMAKNKKTRYIRNEDQARKVAWRQILRWLQAEMALISTGMITPEQIFFPFLLIEKEKTIYQNFLDTQLDNYKLLKK